MYDSVDPAGIPAGAEIVAGYVDGRYANLPAMMARFPTATHVSITVFGAAGAKVGDVEPGCMSERRGAQWARGEVDAHRRPTIYCNTATHPQVVVELAAVGLQFVRDVDWWEAHYDNVATLSPGSVAKQYQSTAQYDISVTNGVWPNATPPPLPPEVHTMDDNTFVRWCYMSILVRPVDGAGFKANMDWLAAGGPRSQVYTNLCDSAEGQHVTAQKRKNLGL